ncbi:scaffold/adaptor protein [Lithospermum erythrorhizon]|uniref:Scaffold/adaptor protein n=1 Tax=Lithospermum erythrorhizon TaxID=34254 RepID=A0AAV3NPA3_LITER
MHMQLRLHKSPFLYSKTNYNMLPENSATERTKTFVNALQELKDLRPQLYSAANYCEKSYVHTEHKQLVLNNLKVYTVPALVNVVDHLGTVAYKLTDLLEQQSLDISEMDLKVTWINQQLLTCKTFMEKEGLRQQQLLAVMPRHHKHYTLPNSVNKKVHFSPYVITDPSQLFQVKSRVLPCGIPAPKALSWHLATETKSTLKGSALALLRPGDQKASERTTVKSNTPTTVDPGDVLRSKNSATHPKSSRALPATSAAIQTLGVLKQGEENTGELTTFPSFGNAPRRQIIRPPARSKSMIPSFFMKYKTSKVSSGSAS